MQRFQSSRRDVNLSAGFVLVLAAAIVGCGYVAKKYNARPATRGSLLSHGYFARAAVSAPLAPAATTLAQPTVATPRPLDVLRRRPKNITTNLVRGYVAAAVGRSSEAERIGIYQRDLPGKNIYLPRIDVYLQEAGTTRRSEVVRTDLSGRFTVRAPSAAKYQLCWRSKLYGSGCLPTVFGAGVEPLFLSTVIIPIPKKDGFAASFGQVRFEDDSLPRTFEPLDDINAFAVVSLLDDAGNVLADVPVNNFGDYLLPYLPSRKPVQLATRIEGVVSTQSVLPQAFRNNRRLVRYHLTIANTPPQLDAIVPVSSVTGKRAQIGTPGETILLETETSDKDGDPVTVRWSTSPNGGVLSDATGPATKWALPSQPGRYYVDAIASDGRGGYQKFRVKLSVGAPGVPFGGTVVGSDGPAVAGARVEINGKVETTDGQGRFIVYVPEADRYVFNIRKQGYGFYSKIYDRSTAGGRWTLTRATVSTFDPTKEIRVEDKRDRRNCPGPDSSRINWKQGGALTQVFWQDGKGNNVPPPPVDPKDDRRESKNRAILPWTIDYRQGDCGPGISVTIPPNGLERVSGGPFSTAEISLATVDLATPEQMPGDDSVERPGDVGWMQSYGAGSVELRDPASGDRLRLRPGVDAEIAIPVDRTQRAAGAPLALTMPLLRYDEILGIWKEDGTLTLDAARNSYVARVNRFSSLNTDVVFTNPSCVRVQSSLATPYDMEVTIPLTGGAAPKVKKITITDPPPHVIYNLPNNTNITIVAIAPGSGSTPPRSLGVFVVNTGPPNATGFGNPPPASACASEVVLSLQTFPANPTSGQFLHGLFSFAGTTIVESDIPIAGTISNQINQATLNYYSRIDPGNDRDTFTKFRATNGFTSPPGFHLCSGSVCADPDNEINVTFANSGDLGFGRDMHCRRTATGGATGFDYACYVTNYGDLARDDALDASDARNNISAGPAATVAMEYSRISSADALTDRHVKFYVYVGDARVNRADLDGRGARPVPQLCMVCHGGAYPSGGTTSPATFASAADVKLGSRFLPFDIRFYTFPTNPDSDKAAQQAAMKRLNQDIVRNAPALAPLDAIADVIDEMYAGGVPNQREEFVVPPWRQTQSPNTAAQEVFYSRVLGNGCRTCHIAQPFQNLSNERAGVDLQFRTARDFLRSQTITTGGSISAFSQAETRVCTEHVMPHASRTHDLFWGQYWANHFGSISPTIAAQYQAFGDTIKALPRPASWPAGESWPPAWNGERCGVFTAAGSTPPSFYSGFVHPLWSRNYGTGAPSGCATCHSEFSGNAAATRNTLLVSGLFGSGSPIAIANNVAGSLVIQRLTGTSAGTRMPQNCPSATRRCLNEAGGPYSPASDPNPADTAKEIDRIKHWIGTGAPP